jgi:hypothetical protein
MNKRPDYIKAFFNVINWAKVLSILAKYFPPSFQLLLKAFDADQPTNQPTNQPTSPANHAP